MVGIISLDKFKSDLEFLNEIQSISAVYDYIEIDDLEKIPSNNSIYWNNDLELD